MKRPATLGQSVPSRIQRVEPYLYALFAGTLTLWVARGFLDSQRAQIFLTSMRSDPWLRPDDWSAPLDDVFIHFDFARSAARGHPFEWIDGNGYSSGGTSLLYPLVLALGYLAGFQSNDLMHFAVTVACVSVFATLLAVRCLFRNLSIWTAYLAPIFFLGVGALDWSLFSGMEVAFFLAMWAGALVAWERLTRPPDPTPSPSTPPPAAWGLGIWNALVVASRPEAAVLVACFSLSVAHHVSKRSGWRPALRALLQAAAPGAFIVIGQAVANKVFTGDSSAAGALVKLEVYDPYLSAQQAFDAWVFHLKYQVLRVTDYHIAGNVWVGSLLWVLAALPLASRRTRREAGMLWLSALLWIATVALNGQVRWQNERYTMPAVAWLLVAAALGLGVLLTVRPRVTRRRGLLKGAAAFAGVTLFAVLAYAQAPKMRGQVWFFGRASRNIRDQHIKVARQLRAAYPTPNRILVGDAGAIPYASDLPALDIIGLGGYDGLPFARSSRWGVAASIELIERIPAAERPDVLALYPSWWGDFPLWFGHRVGGVDVLGNVICGGTTKVIYRADWSALDPHGQPLSAPGGAKVRDEIDLADTLSEEAHAFQVERGSGFVTMKLLDEPRSPNGKLWDAGRILMQGDRISFRPAGLPAGARLALRGRFAPTQDARLRIVVNDETVAKFELERADRWVEFEREIPARSLGGDARIRLEAEGDDIALYHFWILQTP